MKYLTKEGEIEAVKGLDLTVKEHEFISIVGPSGCGKSTLLSLIAGLIQPTAGLVKLDNNQVRGVSSKVGYMLQQDYLYEWRTIYQNAILGLEIQGKATKNNCKKARNLLQKYGLGGFEDSYPNQLSGGMRQRAALIRTLSTEPEVLLLDEPFSALDYQTKLHMENEMYEILNGQQNTALLVTHDIAEAISMSDRVFILSGRPARVKKVVNIDFKDGLTPLQKREVPQFQKYFNEIWEELNIDV